MNFLEVSGIVFYCLIISILVVYVYYKFIDCFIKWFDKTRLGKKVFYLQIKGIKDIGRFSWSYPSWVLRGDAIKLWGEEEVIRREQEYAEAQERLAKIDFPHRGRLSEPYKLERNT